MTDDHTSHLHPPADAHGARFQDEPFVVVLLPQVLRHIGLLAGSALVAGSGGTALFGARSLLASMLVLGPTGDSAAAPGGGDPPVPTVDHTADNHGGH